jgi:hypothetical protein
MMNATEDAARFLHQACQGLPRRLNGHPLESAETSQNQVDRFYASLIEHAVAYFGSRVLYPSRPASESDSENVLSRAACEKAALSVVRAGEDRIESTAKEWGYRIGTAMYDAYLAGKVAPAGLRRLFLAHLDEPGLARKVCATVISKLRAAARAQSRAAHA